jgi:hypothetical protein
LFADVIETVPAALQFYVEAPEEFDALLAERLEYHFSAFNLGPLYAAEGAEELLSIRHQLDLILRSASADEVRAYLEDEAASRAAARLNGWRAAAYEAWAESDWFCEGDSCPRAKLPLSKPDNITQSDKRASPSPLSRDGG